MSYIIKNTAALINTRITDVGRRKISQGNFNIAYFQVGDSEVSYTAVPNYNSTNNSILMPAFNAQNDTGVPESNKQNVKYPFYVQGSSGNTYGIPYMDSKVEPVYNSAGVKGFFSGTPSNWFRQYSSAYTVNSFYTIQDITTITGTNSLTVDLDQSCETVDTTSFWASGSPSVGDIMVIYFDGTGNCTGFTQSMILTYQITGISGNYTTTITFDLDRSLPDFSNESPISAKIMIYPASMVQQIPYSGITNPINYPYIYDYPTPQPNWELDTLNFETPCDVATGFINSR